MSGKSTLIKLALTEAELLLEQGLWVKIHARTKDSLLLEWGVVLSNGVCEAKIASRVFLYDDCRDSISFGPVVSHR